MKRYYTHHFKLQLKQMKKKYPHIVEDLVNALENLENMVSIGHSIYKLRIKSSDVNKGKSGGLRSYVFMYRVKELIVPLCVYSKSEKETISREELNSHFNIILEELIENHLWS